MSFSATQISPALEDAIRLGLPIVALESTVITHGLPYPQNLQLALDMETAIRSEGAVPATIALLDGEIRIGITETELTQLATVGSALKVSQRDFAAAILKKASGGTTVAGTMFAAHRVGIQIFATGGIGGVHKESSFDISSDLRALAETPMVVVCAGAKAILDLPATLEYLETMGVPVIGYRTGEFPGFYSQESGLTVSLRLDSVQEIVEFSRAHWSIGMPSAVLVTNPIPDKDALPKSVMDPVIEQATQEARAKKIHGQALTPFLLQRINELSNGKSLQANIGLLLNNARLAAQIAKAILLHEN